MILSLKNNVSFLLKVQGSDKPVGAFFVSYSLLKVVFWFIKVNFLLVSTLKVPSFFYLVAVSYFYLIGLGF